MIGHKKAREETKNDEKNPGIFTADCADFSDRERRLALLFFIIGLSSFLWLDAFLIAHSPLRYCRLPSVLSVLSAVHFCVFLCIFVAKF